MWTDLRVWYSSERARSPCMASATILLASDLELPGLPTRNSGIRSSMHITIMNTFSLISGDILTELDLIEKNILAPHNAEFHLLPFLPRIAFASSNFLWIFHQSYQTAADAGKTT